MTCDICILLTTTDDCILHESSLWRVVINPNQEYIGRLFVTLKRHATTLSDLTDEEWREFAIINRGTERAIANSFQPSHFNWQALMNDAIRDHTHPHVHWHVIPRYKAPVEYEGNLFVDPAWPHKYRNERPRHLSMDKLQAIRDKLSVVFDRTINE